MSIRDTYLKDYGLAEAEGKKIVTFCKSATGYEQELILKAAQSTYPEIASFIFANLTTGIGYDNMNKRSYIPMSRKDFQGYRRRTIEEYYRLMLLHGKQII